MSPTEFTWPTERVVSAAQRGDRRALAMLLSDSHPNVRRFAGTLCASPEDAEDAAQEALVVLYRKIGTLRAAAALASWMFQIVRHECMRRARLGWPAAAEDAGTERSAEDTAIAHLELERIVAAIAALPDEQRAVVVLRDVQGLSGVATAQALGVSRAAMKSRLHRGRAALRIDLRGPRESPEQDNSNGGAHHA
jgi:RNA polymerase sigma factor (sigma-70 family)